MSTIYFDKLNLIRKRKKISLTEISSKTGFSRSTIWKWEKNLSEPKESQVRAIGKVIDTDVSEFSDMPPEKTVSSEKLSESVETWFELAESGLADENKEFLLLGETLKKLQTKLNNSAIIIRGLMNATNSHLYIKGTDSKYIIANKQFKEALSFSAEFKIFGKRDKDLFPLKEARLNDEEDRKIMLHGEPVINEERSIPGSRRKKYGLISKFPILDSKNRIQGIIGIFVDITEKVKSEKLLKKYINKIMDMENALLNLPYLVYVHKKTGDTISERNSDNYYTNGNEYIILGLSREEVYDVGKNWVNFILPGYRQKIIDTLNSDQKHVEMQYPIKCPKTDKIRWLKESYTVYSDKVCGIVHDITDLKIIGGINV